MNRHGLFDDLVLSCKDFEDRQWRSPSRFRFAFRLAVEKVKGDELAAEDMVAVLSKRRLSEKDKSVARAKTAAPPNLASAVSRICCRNRKSKVV